MSGEEIPLGTGATQVGRYTLRDKTERSNGKIMLLK